MPIRNGPADRVGTAVLFGTAHPNNYTLDTVLSWVLGNTSAKCNAVHCVPVWKGADRLQLSGEALTQTTSHSTLHLGPQQ